MYHALRGGWAVPPQEPEDASEHELLEWTISRYRMAPKRQEVLDLCLLYEKVYLYAFGDWFDFSPLMNEGIIAFVDPVDSAAYGVERGRRPPLRGPYLFEADVPTLQFLKPVLLPYIRRRNVLINSPTYDRAIRVVCDSAISQAALVDLSGLEEHPEALLRWMLRHDASEHYTLRDALLTELGLTALRVLAFCEDLITALDLLQQSARLSSALAAPWMKGSGPTRGPSDDVPIQDSLNYYRVFKVVLEEVEYFPVVESLDDVLRLRSDKRIVDFRDNLRRWTSAIQGSNIDSERKLRGEIRKSNAALRAVRPWKRIGSWLTYLSLPLAVVPALGLPVAVLGGGIQLYIDTTEWRNRWLMVGR